MTIRVFQGERPIAADNKMRIVQPEGIPPAPRGIEDSDIDANGIVSVVLRQGHRRAEDHHQGSGLSDEDIDRMVKDAEANAADDQKRKDLIEARCR